jgi:hypothetical protein
LPANQPEAWRRHWPWMLPRLRPAIRGGGRSSCWPIAAYRPLGSFGAWCAEVGTHFCASPPAAPSAQTLSHLSPLARLVPRASPRWCDLQKPAEAPTVHLAGLLGRRLHGSMADPDRTSPAASHAGWYGLRPWIEQSFKCTKRAGWQWPCTCITQLQRAPCLWLQRVALLDHDPLPLGSFFPAPWSLVPRINCELVTPEVGVRYDGAA